VNKFKLELYGTVSIIILIIITALVSLDYTAFKSESITLSKQILREKNTNVETSIVEKINGYQKVLSAFALSQSDTDGKTLSAEAIAQLGMLNRTLNDVSEGAYIITKNGAIFDDHGTKLTFNVKALNRNYYDGIFNKGIDFFVSEPFESAVSKKKILVFAKRINANSAAIVSVYLKSVLGETASRSDLFIYSKDGMVLVAPSDSLLDKNIYQERPLYKKFSTKNPELYYEADNVDYTAFWEDISVTDWKLVTFLPDAVIAKESSEQLVSAVILGIVSLLIALGILIYIINKLVLKPVGGAPENIAKFMQNIASGDLTQKLADTGKETGIYFSLINLSNQLTTLIKNSHGISESVSSASLQLNAIMNDTKSNSQDEFAQVEQISTAINELSATSQEVSNKAIVAENQTTTARENVATGKDALEKNITLTSEINDSVSHTADIIEELRVFAIEIGTVTDVIKTISEQTNLLALNAAIEAARAGEYGRGFAVVADEVRNLASKTQESTVSIQDIIEKLQTQSEKANSNMAKNVDLIGKSVVLAEHVKASFEDIAKAVESIAEVNSLVATASQQQFCVTEDISKNTTHAFDLVQKNTASIDETLQASSELSQMAEVQQSELAFFKL